MTALMIVDSILHLQMFITGWITSFVTRAPNNQPAPRGLIAHVSTSSGSDHTRCNQQWRNTTRSKYHVVNNYKWSSSNKDLPEWVTIQHNL